MRSYDPQSRPQQSASGRGFALAVLVLCASLFTWMYNDYTDGKSMPIAAFLLVPVGLLALAGVGDPRLLWSVGPRRRRYPREIRMVGGFVFAVGVIAAFALQWLGRSTP